jgi:predicted methyltransferase MtxX (methanogen marker protein 4)
MKGLLRQIEYHAREQRLGRKARVAVGTAKADSVRFRQSLEVATEIADITLVGGQIQGYESADVPSSDASAVAARLFSLAKEQTVDAIVRGQIDYVTFHQQLRNAFPELDRDVMCICLLRSDKHEWFMAPVVHHDETGVEGRCYLARQAARICRQLGLAPSIGILAADDPEGYGEQISRALPIAQTILADYKSAKMIEEILRSEHLDATVFPLRIDEAVSRCNVVVPMDGIIGNFLHRALGYIGGVEMGGCISLTRRVVSIETSRFNDAFETAILMAAALVNLGGPNVAEFPEH